MLEGVRVVETGSGIAPSYAGRLLADAGADVVKVVPPASEPTALFRFLDGGKEIASRNELAARLAVADIVLEALPPHESAWLREQPRSSRSVVVSISPFGRTGPWAEHPATEFTLQALCGSTNRRGEPDREPLAAAGRLGEWVGASYAATVALAYLRRSEETGAGAWVDLALLDAMTFTMQVFMPTTWSFRGDAPPPEPSRAPMLPGVEPTADGFVGLCTITPQQFQDLLLLVERPDLQADEQLRTAAGRSARRDELREVIQGWTRRHTATEVVERATALRIPAAPIGNGDTVTTFDHFLTRNVFVTEPDGLVHPRVPYQIGARALGVTSERARASGVTSDASRARPSGSDASRSRLPLEGIRVADFTAFVAGPFATHLMAALGADVVKIESPRRPDGIRFTTNRPDAEAWWEWSAIFASMNQNKRVVSLDLGQPDGRALALRLVERSDIVIENFSPRVMDGFGLGPDAIHAANAAAVMVRMPAFGLDGPWRDRTGFAMTVEQASGLAWITGYPDRTPLAPGGVCDFLAGLHATFAVLAALRSGPSPRTLIEVPLVEVALMAASEQVIERSATGTLLERRGNDGDRIQVVVPASGIEQWIAVAADDHPQQAALEAIAGGANREAVAAWAASLDADKAVASLLDAGVPAARVTPATSVFEHEQLRLRGFVEQLDHPVAGRHPYPSLPFRIDDNAHGWYRTPAPTIGQHNDEILRDELGVSDDDLERLRAAGVIGDTLLR